MAAAPLRMTAKGSYSPYPIIECFVLPMAGPEEESVRHTGEDAWAWALSLSAGAAGASFDVEGESWLRLAFCFPFSLQTGTIPSCLAGWGQQKAG